MATSMKITRLTAGKIDCLLANNILRRNIVSATSSHLCSTISAQPHVARQFLHRTARLSERKWMRICTLNSRGPHQTYCTSGTQATPMPENDASETSHSANVENDSETIQADAVPVASETDTSPELSDKSSEVTPSADVENESETIQAEAAPVASETDTSPELSDKSSEVSAKSPEASDKSPEGFDKTEEIAPVLKDCDKTAGHVEDTDEPDILYKKLILEVKGHDRKVLHSYEQYMVQTAKQLQVKLASVKTPKVNIYRQSVLASVHIFKKHQVQYEERTYYKVFEFKHLTGSTADTLLEYVQRNLPEGTAMKVTKHQVLPMPPHLKPPAQAKQLQS